MLPSDWHDILQDEFEKDYFKTLVEQVKREYEKHTCHPPIDEVFRAFRLTPYTKTKVLLLGQDPYHNPHQAMGLAFSVNKGVKIPPSLENIFKEYQDDLGYPRPTSGDLTPWGKQGMLLLNAILSVRENNPLSHRPYGWERFTDHVITKLNEKERPMVFVLWGSYARSKKHLIDNDRHLIIENVHPSPLSAYRGFFGSRPFSKINRFLETTGQQPLDFRLP
jgi:uracil-DNA glycosylase